jgi:cytosine/adenosine deaminase-related metal-dependent hydrolase
MLFSNLRIPGKEGAVGLLIEKGKITAVYDPSQIPATDRSGIFLSLPGALVFPGLINSHDHLDFNLFPPLRNRIYHNYTAWGWDIHAHNKAEIQSVLNIPIALRTRWGLYKNLLSGFTTVVNHGEKLATGKELITVFQDCHTLHSVGFERNWRWKLNRLSADLPVVLHVGEGTDAAARREIDQLIRWNFFRRPLIGVHGVAMNERQAAHFKALVWCPDSNYFLLGKTAPVRHLKEHVTMLFGTDSTLTAGWNNWDQVRLARKEGAVTDGELLEMLTIGATKVWGLNSCGEIAVGQRADLVIAQPPSPEGRTMQSFYSLNPGDMLLVMHKGNIRLFDGSLLAGLMAGGFDPEGYFPVDVDGKRKYVEGDLPGLMKDIRRYHPGAVFPNGLGPAVDQLAGYTSG